MIFPQYMLLPREQWGNCKAGYLPEEIETLGLLTLPDGSVAEKYTKVSF